MNHFKTNLQKTCRVLICIHDHGPMKTGGIKEKTGIEEKQISGICSYLCLKGKIKRSNPLCKTGFIWETLQEVELRSKRKTESRTVKYFIDSEKKKGVRQTFLSTKFREEKIKVLKRLIKVASYDDRDLIHSMIADYEVRM